LTEAEKSAILSLRKYTVDYVTTSTNKATLRDCHACLTQVRHDRKKAKGKVMPQIKRALISVFNKKGIVDFARELSSLEIEILSTGGTARILQKAGIPVRDVSQYTQSPSMLGGRVKTLHPKIHGALLAIRENPEQMEEARKYNLELIDMVVINLYPFLEVTQKEGISLEEALENIDIGGPSMLRSAAKNFSYVAAVSNPEQYPQIIRELKENNCFLSKDTCFDLAVRVFQEVSTYNSFIAQYLAKQGNQEFPDILNLSFRKRQELRYGENSHQRAAFYQEERGTGLSTAQKISGKELSFNNLLDLDAALGLISEFQEPAAVVIKHNNPCGAACASSLADAFKGAYRGDPLSAFGSIIGLNRRIDMATAEEIASPNKFIEAIIAPGYEEEALDILKTRQKWGKNVRILKINGSLAKEEWDIKKINGGILLQEQDKQTYASENLKTVTQRFPTAKERDDLLFAWFVCKWVKSNAIVLAKDKAVVGVGAGQMSRIDACLLALRKAGERARGSVLASDAFIPFPDVVEEAKKKGVTALIQPGGALRDKKVIEAANEYGMAMLFTGIRHFKH